MIIHCTRQLARRLAQVSPTPLTDDHPLGGWHANWIEINGTQSIAFCHDRSRYLLFLPTVSPAQLEDLGNHFIDLFLRVLAAEGFETSAIARVARSLELLQFDRSTDRSVLGSMAAVSYTELLETDPIAASLHLSHRPASVRGQLIWPDKVMAEMVQALQAGGMGH